MQHLDTQYIEFEDVKTLCLMGEEKESVRTINCFVIFILAVFVTLYLNVVLSAVNQATTQLKF